MKSRSLFVRCQPRRSRRPARPALTLVEIMIVVAIIAILISVLVPVVGRARDQANRARCAAHQRQLIQAVHAYASANKGYLPFPSEDSASAQWRGPGWLYDETYAPPGSSTYKTKSGNGSNAQFDPREQVKQGSLWPYLNTFDVYHCPADRPPYYWSLASSTGRNAHELTSYLMNWAVGEFGKLREVRFTAVPAFTLQRMPPDGICFWEGDETKNNADMWSDGTNFPDNGLTRRHGNGATVANFDGSCTWISFAEFEKERTSTTRSRLWCLPNTPNGR